MKKNNLILLVDDAEVIRKGLKEILEPEGYVVTMAADGEEALAKFREQYFGLILLDLVLPDIDGLELLSRFKIEQPHVGVVIITGQADLLTSIEALRLGADDYLLKPFDSRELLRRIESCFEKKKHEKILRMHEEVLAVSTDLVCLISPGRRILFINTAFSRTMHYDPEEIQGVSLTDIFGKELYARKIKNALNDCFNGDKSQHQDSFESQEGSSRFYHFSYSPVVDGKGRVSAVVLSIRDLTTYNEVVQQLQKSEERLHLALDISSDGVWDRNVVTGETVYGENWARLLGYTLAELKQGKIKFTDLLHPEDREKTLALISEHFRGETARYVAEFRLRTKGGGWRWILARGQVVERDENGEPLRFMGTHTDITKQKEAELRLLASAERLEELVESRTEELARKTENLEEVNVALTVLLRKRDHDKKELEEQVLTNVKILINPYLEKLKRSDLAERQLGYLNILEKNLNNIISPFLNRLSVKHLGYTPTEIQVANMIKDGMTSKDIAEIMNLSPETVNNHRKHIRKKSGISNKKVNLRTALLSLTDFQEHH
ncbi:MAG: response regulator [Desulfurivibrionaceae bacterium]